jgi:hypothetical protein
MEDQAASLTVFAINRSEASLAKNLFYYQVGGKWMGAEGAFCKATKLRQKQVFNRIGERSLTGCFLSGRNKLRKQGCVPPQSRLAYLLRLAASRMGGRTGWLVSQPKHRRL